MIFEDGFLTEIRLDGRPHDASLGEFGVIRVQIPANPRPAATPGLWMVDIRALYFTGGRFVKSAHVGEAEVRIRIADDGPVVEVEGDPEGEGDW